MVNFRINRDMLPMKGHFFLFNAGTAPLVPFLPTFAKQLGFSSYIVGVMYTFLPIFGLLAKPLFGAIGDRFEKHKLIFITFQILTIGAFSGLYFIPSLPTDRTVRLSCGDGETFFSSCSSNGSTLDQCVVSGLTKSVGTAKCEMSCDMRSPEMWQTVCEHWKIPNYCYAEESTLEFNSVIPKKSINVVKDCLYLPVEKVQTIDNKEFIPKCNRLQEISLECQLSCRDNRINALFEINGSKRSYINMLCSKNETHYTSCNHNESVLQKFISGIKNETGNAECDSTCYTKKSWELPDICEGWKADETTLCRPVVHDLAPTIEFSGFVPLKKTEELDNCLFFNLRQLTMKDGSIHYPNCPIYSKQNKSSHLFQTHCHINCDNSEVNKALNKISSEDNKTDLGSYQIWMFFLFMVLNWIGMAVVVSIADAICFEKLGDKASDYGRQRLWGSAGWGIFSLLTGILIDKFSTDVENKDYTVAFVLMFIFLVLDVIVSCTLQYKQKNMNINIFQKVGILFSSWKTCHFFIWTVLVGMCTGLLWQFLFWHLEDLAKLESCSESKTIKTLQGLVSGIQCFGGEIPFFFISGRILKKIGHLHSMTLVLLGFGLRFILYSLLSNPWWTLPIELFQGLTFGMLYATMASYASSISPPGIEATVMGLVGAVFEGIGTSLGSFVGGIMYGKYGGSYTFRIYGCAALLGCLANIIIGFFKYFRKTSKEAEYSSIIVYGAQNNDAVNILNSEQ